MQEWMEFFLADDAARRVIFAGIIFFAYTAQAIAGFGSNVIAVTTGATFWPIETLPPLVVPLNVAMTGWITLRYWRLIDLRLLFGRILPLMLAGVVVGLAVFEFVAGEFLKNAFAFLILTLTLLELARTWARSRLNAARAALESRNPDEPLSASPVATESNSADERLRAMHSGAARLLAWTEAPYKVPAWFWILLGGITHGLYASGGPLLVYAIGRLELEKGVFRSTLSALWLTLNGVLTAVFWSDGRINAENAPLLLLYLPLVIAGIAAGDWLHQRIPERGFRLLVNLLLLVAAGALLLR